MELGIDKILEIVHRTYVFPRSGVVTHTGLEFGMEIDMFEQTVQGILPIVIGMFAYIIAKLVYKEKNPEK